MNVDAVFKLIVKNLKDILPNIEVNQIKYDSILCVLGASSVDRAELIEKTLEKTKLQSNRFEFHSANNLGELAELFVKKMNENK